MKQYKLLQELPDHTKGDVHTKEYWKDWFKKHKFASQLDNSAWFTESKEIPEWVICIKERTCLNGELNMLYKVQNYYKNVGAYEISDQININEQLVRRATEAEIAAHKLGFHIGDKVNWIATDPITDIIKSFHLSGSVICAKLNNVTHTSCSLKYIEHFKEEPKIITEEGDKLYGDDECWVVNSRISGFGTDNYDNWGGLSDDSKYFSKKENAEQYFSELQTEKRVVKIEYHEGYGSKIAITTDKGGIASLDHVITINELAAEEGLSIGMELDVELVKAWAIYTSTAYIAFSNYVISSFNLDVTTPKFSNQFRWYPIIGFKKFKEQWEKNQEVIKYVEGSDLAIDKTCETCKTIRDLEHEFEPCKTCISETTIYYNWQPKDSAIIFEVSKWYTSRYETFCVTEITCAEVFGYGFSDKGKWLANISLHDFANDSDRPLNYWKLAETKKVNKLLLGKAKKDYRVGTKVIDLLKRKGYINEDSFRFGKFSNTSKDIYSNNGGYCLYENGKWAEIIEEIEFEVYKWYVRNEEVFCYQKVKGNRIYGYGFVKNLWTSGAIWAKITDKWRLADMEKVNFLLLEKAKKDYPEGTQVKYRENKPIHTIKGNLKIGTFGIIDKNEICYGSSPILFDMSVGIWAEIVTEKPKLMLGDKGVTITINNESPLSVWTEKGFVSVKDWLDWYNKVEQFYSIAKTGKIGLKLAEYTTLSVANGITEIGCIKNITWKQLRLITEAIKNL